MDISKRNQEQIAGDNSTQTQLIGDNSQQTIINNQNNSFIQNNYTYTRMPASEIVALTTTVSEQVTKQALAMCTQVAESTVCARINSFEKIWIPRISNMENVVNHLKEPKFQFMLLDAKITAAKSTREEDLTMLSELLACHIEKWGDIKIDAGINKAISIVNEVDIDSLCALTVVLCVLNIVPAKGNIDDGLNVLNKLYAKLLSQPLPEGDAWIDNLNIVGAINILTGNFPKFDELLSTRLDGYLCVGIKSGTQEHERALEILEQNNFSKDILRPHELLPEYLRLSVVNCSNSREELKPIFALYSKDKSLMQTVRSNFMSKWNSYQVLTTVKEWFDEIPFFIRINSVGKALAQTNAKRCYPEFPDLI